MANKKQGNGGGCLILAIGVLVLLWFFSSRETKTPEQQREEQIQAYVRDHAEPVPSYQPETPVTESTITSVKRALDDYAITYYKVEKAESGCIWVYIPDNGKNRAGLASTICQASRGASCITLVDRGGSSLGRSLCK